jgi:riboflavin synthase
MFTGIVEAVGEVAQMVESTSGTYLLEIRTALATQMKIGDSLSNNGVCLTVISQNAFTLGFDLLAETVTRSNLIDLKDGDLVNLERSMAVLSRFDGHIVQGHVDTTAKVLDSLTVAELNSDRFVIWIIPHTWSQTNLHRLRSGDSANLEFDLIAKYVERLMGKFDPKNRG